MLRGVLLRGLRGLLMGALMGGLRGMLRGVLGGEVEVDDTEVLRVGTVM